jgi:uncharacterized SAM-binding protein YcdF (DUF218 family)
LDELFAMSNMFSKTVKIFLRCMTALGLLVLLVTISPVSAWLAGPMSGDWNDPKGDILIVLTGGSFDDGVMSESSLLRSAYAARAYKDGFHSIIISGGSPNGATPIAKAMADMLVLQGVPREVITLETASLSTRDSAVNLKLLLDHSHGTKVLLTSDYHMFRARRSLQKAGLDVLPRPVPDVIKRSNGIFDRWPSFLELVKEWVKIGYYFGRGWI